jgi:hypothetical protein
MSVSEVINSISLVVIAVSLAVIAYQLVTAAGHLGSLAKLVKPLTDFLSRQFTHDPDPHHHYYSITVSKDRAVWEWREGKWVLRPESSKEIAGSPPDRPGTFEGECVTTPKRR